MTKGTNILHLTVNRLLSAAALLLSLAAGGCSTDGTSDGTTDFAGDEPVIVTANAAESALTRAKEYVDHGEIKTGTYYLSYPTDNVAEVEFQNSEYGRAMVMPGRGALIWKQIGNGSSDRTLCLTNVSPEKGKDYKENSPFQNPIIFKDDETQFVAGRYRPYGEDNTNDILLGNKSSYRTGTDQNHNSNYVHFEMHHCMARVRVIVETHSDDASFDPLKGLLNEAKVEITNVVLKPYSFVPYTTNLAGVVALYPTGRTMEDYCTFESIYLLDSLEDDSEDDWADRGDALDDDKKVIGEAFTTEDILLPPQQLRADDNRPRLRITVFDKEAGEAKVYSGVLPHIMYKDESPLQFEFLAEHLLTIRTFIKNDPPELIFMPVQVVEWVDKGTYSLDAQEAGIYSEADFENVIKYYAKEYNQIKLLRYGTYKDGKWVFKVFHNLEFTKKEIENKMPLEEGKPDYSFTFNTWFSVKVDDEKVTETELKDILSGKDTTL